ncbi:MAG TPA: hypothetical protein ENK74_01230, partial [Nitratifractor sp.]|nr:hypothetical protein [Nitratifractor sp.]
MKIITLLSVAAIVACSSFVSAGDIIDLTKKSANDSITIANNFKVNANNRAEKDSGYAKGE